MKKLLVSVSLTYLYASNAYAGGADKASSHHGDAGGHHEASTGLPQLDPTYFTSQAFWLVVIFALMYLIFSFKSLPTISQTISTRDERIKNDLASAQNVKEEVEEVQNAYEESLKQAREESSKLFADIEAKIKSDSEQHAKDFTEKSSQKIDDLEKSIAKARKKAMDDMSEVAADIANEAAEKIIGIKADKTTAKKVVESINKAA